MTPVPCHSTRRGLARALGLAPGLVAATGIAACRRPDPSAAPPSNRSASATAPAARYVPRVRDVAITTVPLLVTEQQAVLPFLAQDFARGGVVEGKEVYAFSPSTLTVVEGDTLHLTLIDPEDDVHSFVLPDFAVALPGQRRTTATYVAKRARIYPFVCAIQAHLPMMAGQLVVLPAAGMAGVAVAAAPQ